MVLGDPVTRRYADDGRLAESTAGGPGAVVDVLELSADEVAAFEASPAPVPMLVTGSFTAVRGADTLGRFLVGGAVLDTNVFDGHRCPSEQTALGLWRIARLRGGAFWDGVADLIAAWVETRITSAVGVGPVHSVWGDGETHVRFLADAALLLLAAERSAASRAVDLLEQFAVPLGGGQWFVHDSLELARGTRRPRGEHPRAGTGRARRVGSSHRGGLRRAGRRPRSAAAAHAARRSPRAGWPSPTGSAVTVPLDCDPRPMPSRGGRSGGSLVTTRRTGTSGSRAATCARDASVRAAPHYYFGVNLYDLGVLVANRVVDEGGPVDRAFRDGASMGASHGLVRRAAPVGHGDRVPRTDRVAAGRRAGEGPAGERPTWTGPGSRRCPGRPATSTRRGRRSRREPPDQYGVTPCRCGSRSSTRSRGPTSGAAASATSTTWRTTSSGRATTWR